MRAFFKNDYTFKITVQLADVLFFFFAAVFFQIGVQVYAQLMLSFFIVVVGLFFKYFSLLR